MLPLKNITLQNFRSVEHLQFDLNPQLTVLHGQNAAGKTTLLDALAIALAPIARKLSPKAGRALSLKMSDLRAFYPPALFGAPQAHVADYASLSVEGQRELRWSTYKRKSSLVAVPAGLGQGGLNTTLAALAQGVTGDAAVTLPIVAYYGTDRAVPHLVRRRRNLKRQLARLDTYDSALDPGIDWKQAFEWFFHMEDRERRQQQKRQDLAYRDPALAHVRRALSSAVPGCSNPRTEVDPTRFVVDFQREGGAVETLAMHQMSHGYRTFAAMVMDLARRMVSGNPHLAPEDCPALVLIDEIDLHLHPLWQQQVVPSLLKAFPKTQFVISTHSDQVLSSVAAASVRTLTMGAEGLQVSQPPFAEGATAEEIHTELMGVASRAPGPVTAKLDAYLRLVAEGEGQSEAALDLRAELDAIQPGRLALQRADRALRRVQVLAQMGRRP
jgi:predicted ATP-binding protein involved in virulence